MSEVFHSATAQISSFASNAREIAVSYSSVSGMRGVTPSSPLTFRTLTARMQKVEATVLGGWEIRRGKMWRMAAVFAVTGALALSGCSSKSEEGAETTPAAPSAEKVDAIANTVPEAIKSSGKLVIGVNIPYAPNEFKDPSGKIVGFDVDLMNAVAATLGLTPEYRESDFAKIIPSIQGGTFNVGMSSFTDTKEREQTVDFVDLLLCGHAVGAETRQQRIDPENACGKKVAVQATTVQETDELSGKKQEVHRRRQAGDRDHARSTARTPPPTPSCSARPTRCRPTRRSRSYAIKQSNGKLEQAGEIFDSAPYGWPVAKGSPLAQSLLQALEHLIESGTYKTIATNWGVEKGMIDKPVINGAVN